jgi:molybdate transport system substrate-binding protein
MSVLKPRFPATAVLLFLVLFATNGCGDSPSLTPSQDGHAQNKTSLRIAVATNFKPAFERLTQLYLSQDSSVAISTHYASSGLLYAQISHGAPYHIFLSADRTRAQNIWKQQNPDTEIFTYAYGQLVLWVPGIENPGFQWLQKHRGSVAIANPELAPYGQAAMTCLDKQASHAPAYQLVLGSSVAQAFHFVASGAASAGLVAKSQVLDYGVARNHYHLVPADCYAPIEQQAVAIDAPAHQAEAPAISTKVKAFMKFLRSKPAQSLIEEAGYLAGHSGAK